VSRNTPVFSRATTPASQGSSGGAVLTADGRVDFRELVKDLVAETCGRDDGHLHLSGLMEETISRLRMFLYENVYRNYRVHNEFIKAQKIIRELYTFFLEHEFPGGSPSFCETGEFGKRAGDAKTPHRQVCDFIAGMTDRYALDLYTHIFMPKPWSVF